MMKNRMVDQTSRYEELSETTLLIGHAVDTRRCKEQSYGVMDPDQDSTEMINELFSALIV